MILTLDIKNPGLRAYLTELVWELYEAFQSKHSVDFSRFEFKLSSLLMDNQCVIVYEVFGHSADSKLMVYDEDERFAIEKIFNRLNQQFSNEESLETATATALRSELLPPVDSSSRWIDEASEECQIPKPFNQAYILSQMQ